MNDENMDDLDCRPPKTGIKNPKWLEDMLKERKAQIARSKRPAGWRRRRHPQLNCQRLG